MSDDGLKGREKLEHQYGHFKLGLRFLPESVLRPKCDGMLIVTLIRAVDLVVADTSGSSGDRFY